MRVDELETRKNSILILLNMWFPIFKQGLYCL